MLGLVAGSPRMMRNLAFCLLLLPAPAVEAASGCPTDAFLDISKFAGAGEGHPAPRLEVKCEDDALVIRSNAIPHYRFVPITPNPLVPLERDYRLPLRPKLAEEPGPLPLLGPSGVAINGIPLFGPNEGPAPYPGYGDPIYNDIMDDCMGHTARQYHYHALVEACLEAGSRKGGPSPILAFAADGFPVYGPFGCNDADCSEVIEFKSGWDRVADPRHDAWDAYRFTTKEGAAYLDRCNGHSGDDHGGAYHYHATAAWPYIMGCYSGTPLPGFERPEDRQFTQRGPRRDPAPLDPRPTDEQVARAATELGIPVERLAQALRLTDGRVAPMNYAASARALGVEHRALSEALGVPMPNRGRRGPPRGPRGGRPRPR